jgi:transcriptional regulator with XRE-family HTH domain
MAHPGKKTGAARNAALLFGRAVREARIAAKLTLEQAAKKADVKTDFLSRVERGEKPLPFAAMMRLADACKVKPDAFWRWSEPQTANGWRDLINKSLDGCTVRQLRRFLKILLELRIE